MFEIYYRTVCSTGRISLFKINVVRHLNEKATEGWRSSLMWNLIILTLHKILLGDKITSLRWVGFVACIPIS
jgi:hypothetical protein